MSFFFFDEGVAISMPTNKTLTGSGANDDDVA
jgi:hypothetical protein